MVELVDTQCWGRCSERSGSSSLLSRTNSQWNICKYSFLFIISNIIKYFAHINILFTFFYFIFINGNYRLLSFVRFVRNNNSIIVMTSLCILSLRAKRSNPQPLIIYLFTEKIKKFTNRIINYIIIIINIKTKKKKKLLFIKSKN